MKSVVIVLVIAVIALSAGTIHVKRQMDGARREAVSLRADLARADLARAELAGRPVAQSTSALSANPREETETSSNTSAAQIQASERIAAARAVAASPERQEMARALFRARLPVQYPDIGVMLDLSQEEVEQLFDLLTQQDQERRTAFSADQAGQDLEAAGHRAEKNATDLVRFFGSKYPQWARYQRELPAHRHMRDLSAVLDSSGTPLSGSQAQALLPALVEVQVRFNQASLQEASQPGRQPRAHNPSNDPERNRRMVEAVSRHVTPQQLEAYRQMMERQERESFFGR